MPKSEHMPTASAPRRVGEEATPARARPVSLWRDLPPIRSAARLIGGGQGGWRKRTWEDACSGPLCGDASTGMLPPIVSGSFICWGSSRARPARQAPKAGAPLLWGST